MSGANRNDNKIRRLSMALQASRQLGLRPLAYLALYRLGIKSGHYHRVTSSSLAGRLASGVQQPEYTPLWELPPASDLSRILGKDGRSELLTAAGRIIAGRVTLFGKLDAPLRLVSAAPLVPWTTYTGGLLAAPGRPEEDIKFVWEPARFGWAYTLGRAYLLTGDERYPRLFWERLEEFLVGSPAYLGPHWASAQEVGLRLIAFTFALQAFHGSPASTPERVLRLLQAVAVHAGRIPPTLPYALAQDNNHLLSEAAALVTAGLLLPEHPKAKSWRLAGWKWFNRGVQSQVAADGAYSQNSTNYHRLMLQLGLWMHQMDKRFGGCLRPETRLRLAAATRWLVALLDPVGGGVPNLGPNDGAYIFPLTVCPFEDYRPVLQAASSAFLGEPACSPGLWDEMGLWFCLTRTESHKLPSSPPLISGTGSQDPPHVLRSPDGQSWVYLRAARFSGRPGHADQLHLDLWWRGLNIAQDAGTYQYNAPPPWDNSLARTEMHNTVTLEGREQMTRAGKFLYLDWAQAEVLPPTRSGGSRSTREGSCSPSPPLGEGLAARHNGYRRLGVWHSRTVVCRASSGWEVVDEIYPVRPPGSKRRYTAALHWLLPDWPWKVIRDADSGGVGIEITSPYGPVYLYIEQSQASDRRDSQRLQIVRAGELLYGIGAAAPNAGWVSPTYGVKIPALAVRFSVTAPLSIRFLSIFTFP